MQLKSFDDITTRYRHIFLSPHFDDVVYSCGGTVLPLLMVDNSINLCKYPSG